MSIDEVFKAMPVSVSDFMRERGQCFYVPAYQRQYSWDDRHIIRLLDDTCHGLDQLTDRPDALTFLGTLIMINDREYKTIRPLLRREVPGVVMTIIDGQQRLTSLLLLSAALYELISMLEEHAGSMGDADASEWMKGHCVATKQSLLDTLVEDRLTGDAGARFYPRMIRAHQDTWSRRDVEAQYTSDIACFLKQFHTFSLNGGREFGGFATDTSLAMRFIKIRKLLKGKIAGLQIRAAKDDEIEFPTIEAILGSKNVAEALFNESDIPLPVRDALTNSAVRSGAVALFRVIAYARFIQCRVAVTVVQATQEDYAFDIFEALNTTGEPLTAIETFVPRVIEAEDIQKYEQSPSYAPMKIVTDNLASRHRALDRQRATEDLLIPFALAENGKKLSKRLNEQRRYLIKSYDKCTSIEEKREFVQHLAILSGFTKKYWRTDAAAAAVAVGDLARDAEFCLALLREAGHTVVIAPLSRFYGVEVQEQEFGASGALESAIRAVAAFFGLWRGAKGGTANIDSIYRDLMASGDAALGVPALCRRGATPVGVSAGEQLNVSNLKLFLRARLEREGIATKEQWVRAACRIPVYNKSTPLARLLLIAAMQDTVVDAGRTAMRQRGRSGTLNLMTADLLHTSKQYTIEHIAPQVRAGGLGWSDDLYDDVDLIHTIGNLTLLPQHENSVAGNARWVHKQLLYRAMSAQTEAEFAGIASESLASGVTIPPGLVARKFLPVASGIGQCSEPWSRSVVEARSVNLCELAWDTLAPWIGI